MRYTDYTGILPAQEKGKDLEVNSVCQMDSVQHAADFFRIARARLLDVNHWHEVAGTLSAEFVLTNAAGQRLERPVREGDFIRIDIPGPGSAAGGGYDWVRVQSLKEFEEEHTRSIAFQVRPTSNPTNDEPATAHFYGEEASSTFAVSQVETTVAAFVVDRNLVPNDEGAHFLDAFRNSTIGIAALGMFSKVQWQNLVNGLVQR